MTKKIIISGVEVEYNTRETAQQTSPEPRPHRGSRIDHPLSHDEIRDMSYTQMMNSGQAYGPTKECLQEGIYGPIIFTKSRLQYPGRRIKRKSNKWLLIVTVLLWLFICIIPSVQIILNAA